MVCLCSLKHGRDLFLHHPRPVPYLYVYVLGVLFAYALKLAILSDSSSIFIRESIERHQ